MSSAPQPGDHRISVVYGEDSFDFTVEQYLAKPPSNGRWEVTQRWSEPAVPAGERRGVVTASARAHGWMLPDGRWPAVRKGHRLVFTDQIWIYDHQRVIADITAHREQILGQLDVAEELWRQAIAVGSVAGGLGSAALADAAGVSSSRIRQLLTQPATRRPTTSGALQWKKN